MKSLLFLLYLTTLSYGEIENSKNLNRYNQFVNYMETYNKSYSTSEYWYRYKIFGKNML